MQIQINIHASQDLFSRRPSAKSRSNTIYIHLFQPFCLKILSIVLLCMHSLYYGEHYSDIMTSVPRRLPDELNAPNLMNRLVDVLNMPNLGFSLLWRDLPLLGLLQSLQASVEKKGLSLHPLPSCHLLHDRAAVYPSHLPTTTAKSYNDLQATSFIRHNKRLGTTEYSRRTLSLWNPAIKSKNCHFLEHNST